MGLWQRLHRTFSSRRLDAEITEEIEHHLELRQGEPTRTRFGDAERVRERTHDKDVIVWLETWVQDLRHAAHMLRRSPGFTAVILVSLAIGVGANAAIFSLLNTVLLKTLPVPNPQQIVLLGQSDGEFPFTAISYPLVQQIGAAGRAAGVQAGAASSTIHVALGPESGSRVQASVQLVTGGYFSTLGIKPVLGRWITDGDNRAAGASPVAVISYSLWQQHWGGRLTVLGQNVQLGSHALTVIGIAPRGFNGLDPASPADIWAPVMMQSALQLQGNRLSVNGNSAQPWAPQEQIAWLQAFARFPSVSVEARLQPQWNNLLQQSWKRIDPNERPWHLTLTAGGHGADRLRSEYGAPLRMLQALAALMLLIAVANVATLLLARAVRRRREVAIRLAIGISRARLSRQLITEGLVLATAAGAAAAALAYWLSGFLAELAGTGSGAPFGPDLNWRVWVLLALVSLGIGIVLGILPAWQAERGNPAADLKAEAGQNNGSRRVPLGRWLIVAQVALALLLVAGAGLFARSLAAMFHADLGFQTSNLLEADLSLRGAPLNPDAQIALEQALLARVRALPGVASAALAVNGLDSGSGETSGVAFPGQTVMNLQSQEDTVTRSYFSTVGMALLRGREFTGTDTATSPKVVIVNQAFVHAYYHGRDPVGQTFGYGITQTNQFRIIGVATDARTLDPHTPAAPMFFHLAEQTDRLPLRVLVRGSIPAAALTGELRTTLAGTDARLHVSSIATMEELIGKMLSRDRLIAELSAGFGLLALLLACLGVYGVMAYAVAARTGEFGLRMALGATRSSVLGMVLAEAARLLVIGAVAGIGITLLGGRWAQPLLPGVSAADPATLAAALAAMLAVPLLAALLPAWRAARANPAAVLRAQG